MADDNAKLLIVLEAQSKKLQNQLADATRTIDRFAAQTNRRFDSMNAKNAASFQRLNKTAGASLSVLSSLIGKAFAGAAALRGAQILIDSATRIENSLKVAGLAGEQLTKVYDALFESAQRNAAPVEALVDLYGRASLVQKELGVSSEELLGFTDNIAVALRVSGKSAAESSGALLQLSQALGSGTVRAEEFNSILEGALPIAQAAAAGLTEAGGSVAKLRQLVVDGKVSSEAFFRAFEAGSVILTEKVANAELTVSQQFIRLQNVLIDTAGKFDDATSASGRVGAGLEALAGFIERVGAAIAANGEKIDWFVNRLGDASNAALAFADTMSGGTFSSLSLALDVDIQTKAAEQEAERAAAAIAASLQAALDDAMLGLEDWKAGWGETLPPALQASVYSLIETLIEGGEEAALVEAALIGLGSVSPDFADALSALGNLAGELQRVRGEAGATAAAVAGVNVTGAVSYAGQDGAPPKPVVTPVSLSDYKPPVGSGGGGSKKSPGEKFEDTLDKQRERNRLLAEETALQATLNPLVNDYGFALEKLRVQQELQSAATAAGIELTPALKATIDELATGYANASVEAAKLAESQEQIKQIADDFGEAGKSAIKGFISDLREGKSAADALGNAMSSILDSVIDIGLNMLLGGLTGGLGGGIGKLFGFSDGGVAAHGRPKMFAKGGVSNTAAIFGEAGPEAAVPLPDGRRIPVELRQPSGSSAKQSMHITVGVSADSAGNLTPYVESVADSRVAKAAPSIGGAAVRTSLSQAPMATSEYQARHG